MNNRRKKKFYTQESELCVCMSEMEWWFFFGYSFFSPLNYYYRKLKTSNLSSLQWTLTRHFFWWKLHSLFRSYSTLCVRASGALNEKKVRRERRKLRKHENRECRKSQNQCLRSKKKEKKSECAESMKCLLFSFVGSVL